MSEPAKPFACTMPECGMTFTNEDHLHVHTKKHDMVLQLGLEQKAGFIADQTPTPTRFIRNCEEVGLFQDLQNVAANPFDEGFKRAMEAKAGILSLEMAPSSDDVLHTPQMVFPLLEGGDPTLFNAQRNTTISRSSSDESGTIKEFETRTISKLTNEVTTISRIVNNDDVTIEQTDIQKDTVCYKNNVIKIESNIIRKDIDNTKVPVLVYTDSVIKETNINNVVDNSKLIPEKLPIMSQKSIDFVVDSFTSELETNSSRHVEKTKNSTAKFDVNKINDDQIAKIAKVLKRDVNSARPRILRAVGPKILPKETKTIDDTIKSEPSAEDYEVVIKFPDGKRVRMKPADETDPKEILRNRLTKKVNGPNIRVNKVTKPIPKVVNIPTGTLIPVTLVNKAGKPLSNNDLHKVPITKINNVADIGNIKFPVTTVNKKANTNTIVVNNKKALPITIKKPNLASVELTITSTSEKNKIKENPKQPEPEIPVVHVTEEMVNNTIQEKNKRMDIEDNDDDCVIIYDDDSHNTDAAKFSKSELERRSAASKRYRERLKYAMRRQSEENRQLREANQRLIAEKAVLKLIITEHMKGCPNANDIVDRLATLSNGYPHYYL